MALRAERNDILGEEDNSRQGTRNRRSGFAGPTIELVRSSLVPPQIVTSIHGVRNLRLTSIL